MKRGFDMFDVLGVVSFLFVIYCIVMCIASVFSRKINRKLWIAVMFAGLVIFFTSYALDTKFDKDEPIEIDFSDVQLETPSPSPEITPSPVVTPSPENDVAGEIASPEPSADVAVETPSPEPEADDAETPEETPDTADVPTEDE